MAWDATRPVPWQRLVREWFVYVAIMAVVFLVLFRDRPLLGIFGGLLASGPLYLAFGYVLAKFGYQRKTLREMRSGATAAGSSSPDAATETRAAGPRPRPAPTKRTGGSSSRPSSGKRRR